MECSMKKNKQKPLNFKPFEIIEAHTECTVNPDTGDFRIMVFGKIENMKDYDYKNSSEIFNKFLLTYVFMQNAMGKELRQIQDYIMKHFKKWF